jgi:hypothetical protein
LKVPFPLPKISVVGVSVYGKSNNTDNNPHSCYCIFPCWHEITHTVIFFFTDVSSIQTMRGMFLGKYLF